VVCIKTFKTFIASMLQSWTSVGSIHGLSRVGCGRVTKLCDVGLSCWVHWSKMHKCNLKYPT